MTSKFSDSAVFVGVDMAWGEKNPDGLCCLVFDGNILKTYDIRLSYGDTELHKYIAEWISLAPTGIIAVDAPLIIRNHRGMRPVDKLTHALYRRQHAGCHPAYLDKIQRPVRLSEYFSSIDIPTTYKVKDAGFSAIEVYPHITMLHAFSLDKILKYKKGSVQNKRLEFERYQRLLLSSLTSFFNNVEIDDMLRIFLSMRPWSKALEDQTDAFLCALVGWHHWISGGQGSEVLGNEESGFIVSCRKSGRWT